MQSRRAPLHPAVCSTLIEARKEAGVTQAALAQQLGWAQSAVSRVESGDRLVDLDEFVRIADALGVDPLILMQRILASS